MLYNKTKTLDQNSGFEKRLKKQDVVEKPIFILLVPVAVEKKAARGTAGCSASSCSLKRSWSTSCWNPFSTSK